MKEAEIIGEIVRQELAMSPLTPQQELDFQKATHRGNCNTPFSSTNQKVRHHYHVSGRYLFPCCNNCNLKLKPVKRCKKKVGGKREHQSTEEWAAEQYTEYFRLPIVFHNLKDYDSRFAIKHFQRKFTRKTNDGGKYF